MTEAIWQSRRLLVITLLVGLFAWFVWPTPYYRYRATQVNRFTGAQCLLGESCWTRPATSAPAVSSPSIAPSSSGSTRKTMPPICRYESPDGRVAFRVYPERKP